jgi:hypothetical protein
MSKLVIHRPRLAHIQADITAKKKIHETVLKYSKVCGGGGLGVTKANLACNPIIFMSTEPIQNF